MVSFGFYILKVVFYIKNTNFGLKGPEFWLCNSNLTLNENIFKVNMSFCPSDKLNSNDIWFPWVFTQLKWVFTSKTLILAQKGPEFGLYTSESALNENIHKVNVPFCPADNSNSIGIWFSWVFTQLKWVFTSKTLILAQKGPEFGLYTSESALNENIHKVNVPFCPADNSNSIGIWFSWVFTQLKWVFTSKTLILVQKAPNSGFAALTWS